METPRRFARRRCCAALGNLETVTQTDEEFPGGGVVRIGGPPELRVEAMGEVELDDGADVDLGVGPIGSVLPVNLFSATH